ncbi:MAG: hypothetical protein ACYC4H_04745 [Desulfocucumaceae bacterium]
MEEQGKQEKETAREIIEKFVISRTEDAIIEFVDRLNLSWNDERIIFTFVQMNPGGLAADNDQVVGGRVVKQLAVSWPHAVRIRNVLDKLINSNRDAVIKRITDSMEEEKNE